MVRYLIRTGSIVLATQIVFLLLQKEMSAALANAIALISMLYPGLWLDKRFVWQNKDPFTLAEVKEFLSVALAPTIISPIAIFLAGDLNEYILVAISIGVFGFFWVLRFLLHKRRWNDVDNQSSK